MADPHKIWREQFAEKFAQERAAESERRDIAFLDVTFNVCGEEVRCMTARDMLILDGLKNPFVSGGEISPGHIPQFLWLLHSRNDPSRPVRTAFQKGLLIGRVRRLKYIESIKSISEFIETMFLDSPAGRKPDKEGGGDNRGLQTCFLAPLLMRIARDVGSLDPASGLPLIHSPLPRLFQYLKDIRARAEGKEFMDTSPSDRLIDEWLIEWNAQMGAEQLAAQGGK
jgi:hypothetical protein